MRKWVIACTLLAGACWLAAGDLLAAEASLPAFPGAEGFGAMSVGGRGGRVIKVTNLNPSGPGSLAEACAAEGPRIVVFDVSGVIPSSGRNTIRIKNPCITIAGQTAPGAGITIDGMLTGGPATRDGRLHDVTIRFLRVRQALKGYASSGDCFQIGSTDRLILDHISASWAADETVDMIVSKDITVQWSTIEESKIAHEGSGLHNYGMIMGYVAGDATLHHNLFAHHSERAPLCGLDTLDHRNNVIYNVEWAIQFHPTRMNRRDQRMYRMNLVGCTFKDGPSGPVNSRPWLPPLNRADPGISDWENVQTYGKGNYWAWAGKEADYDPRLEEAVKSRPKCRVAEPWPVPPVTTHSAKEAYDLVLAQAGCLPRDAVSRRTIQEVQTGTGYWGEHRPAGGLMEGLTPGTAAPDADNDGMPDAWETANGLNPNDPSDAGKTVPPGASKDDRHKGYTYIEFYVNDLADQLVAKAREQVSGVRGQVPGVGDQVSRADLGVGAAPRGRPDLAARRSDVAAGGGHTLVLKDGTVWAWGSNWRGELGDGTGKDTNKPVQTKDPAGEAPLTGVVGLVSSGAHVMALRQDGTLLGWGYNEYGEVGNGETGVKTALPVPVKGPEGEGTLTGVVTVAAGCYHTLAVRKDGTVWAWGCNMDGRLGDGSRVDRHTPVQVKGPDGKDALGDVVAVSAGVKHSMALRADGTVWCWGGNLYGELGDGTNEDRPLPVQVPRLSEVAAIAAGWHHSVALRKDGTVWAWGCNHFGQVGDDTELDRNRPVQVKGPGGEGGLRDVDAIACGGLHTLARRKDGTLWAFGWNYRGQLGDGTSVSRSVPVQVVGPAGGGFLTGVVAFDGGGAHSVARLKDGALCTWGENLRGQIGDGTITSWMKGATYVEAGGKSASEMRKEGAELMATRPWPMRITMP